MRRLDARDFDIILDRLVDHRRIAVPFDNCPRLAQPGDNRLDRAFGINCDALARQMIKLVGKGSARQDGDGVAEMAAHFGRQLGVVDEQFSGAIGVQQRKGQRHRGAADVCPANIESPGNRIERGHHRRVELMRLEPLADGGALVGARTAGIAFGLHGQRRIAGDRPVAPHRVDRVGGDRHQRRADRLQRFAHRRDPLLAVQPCVVADACARRGIAG